MKRYLVFFLLFSIFFFFPVNIKAQESGSFGNPTIPDYLDVVVSEDDDFVIVDSSDSYVFKFRKGTTGYNEIYLDGQLLIEDERWRLEWLHDPSGQWRLRGEAQSVSYTQFSSFNVVVSRFYTDFEGTSFNVTYDFYGGFRPKISFSGYIGQEDDYRIVWSCSGINTTFIEDEPFSHQVKFWSLEDAVSVMNYEDVYDSFGDITSVDIEVSANNHKVDEIFNVGFLEVGFFYLDPSFGIYEEGANNTEIENYLKGISATCPEAGTAQSISAFIRSSSTKSNVLTKCVLYNASDYSKIAETEERSLTITSTPEWFEFNFSDPKPSLINADYLIMCACESVGGAVVSIRYIATGTRYYESITYPTFPATLSPSTLTGDPSIYCNYTVAGVNNAPTNDQCSITDLDDTDDLYAQKQLYTVDYDVTDADGFADIDYCEVRFKQGASTRAIFRYDEDTDTFSVESGSTEWTLDGSSSATESGTYINVTMKVAAQWDATEEADLEIECYVVDDEPESDTDTMQTDYFDVITNLVTGSIECTDPNDPDRVDVSSSITIDFTVRYANEPGASTASSFYPPDAEFTSVSVYDSVNNNKGTDSSIVDGAGSVTFNAESTVKSEDYNLYIDMADADYTDGEETTTETVISDQMEIVSVAFDDSRVDINAVVEVRYVLRYDYDDVSFEGGDGSIVGFTWDAVNSWWDKSVNAPSSPSSENYDENDLGALTDSNYGLTVYEDDAGSDLIGDRITFLTGTLETTDARINYDANGEWYVELKYEYDDAEVTDGSVALNTESMSWDAGEGRWEYTYSKGSVGLESRNIASVSGNTHGITELNSAVTSDSEDVVYDQLDIILIEDDTGDQRIDVGSTFEIRYNITYDYDDVLFDDGKGSISGFVWDGVNAWWDKEVTGSSSVTSTNYDETYVSITDSTYGLTKKKDVAGIDIITDRIIILTLTANDTTPDVDQYVELRVTLELEYDSHTLDDGTNDAVNLVDASSPSMSWDVGDSRWEVEDVRASPQEVVYDEVTGSEDTYGITVVNMNGKSVTVTWSTPSAYYYLTVFFEGGLTVLVNGSSVGNASENEYDQDIYLNMSSSVSNGYEFFKYERDNSTFLNVTLDNPIYFTLANNQSVWVYSIIEGEPLLYESVWIFGLLWIGLLGFFLWNRNDLLRGGTVLVGFILGLTIHSSISTTLGTLLGFVIVCVNVGLLVSVLFEK